VFSWSYRSLSTAAERAFRLIGLHPGGSITIPAAAAILGVDVAGATRLVQELVDAQLIKETVKGRFRYHDLLRAYAIDRAQADESHESRHEALARILTWYLYCADAANRVLAPSRRHVVLPPLPAGVTPLEFDSYDTALAWCESQRLNLAAATESAESNGFLKLAWMLPSSLFSFFYVRWYLDDWISTYSVGSRAAENLGDLPGQSIMLNRLGVAYKEQGLFSDALPRFEAALAVRRQIDDRQGEATALSNMGLCATGLKNAQQALLLYHDSVKISIEVSDTWTEGWSLHNLGEAESALGLYTAARDSELASLRIGEQIGDRIVQALALEELGEVYHALGEYSEAMAFNQRALSISRDLGHRAIEARVLRNMGCTLAQQDSLTESLAFFTESIGLSEVAGDRLAAARTVMALGDVLCRQADDERRLEAKALFLRAAALFAEMGSQEDADLARKQLAVLPSDDHQAEEPGGEARSTTEQCPPAHKRSPTAQPTKRRPPSPG
jgi:tetratricopeptide (TPR) repeat protein